MNKVLTLALALISIITYGQKNPTEKAQPIVTEGKLLYRLEKTSWLGTDLFLEHYKNSENIGGYFSYIEKDVTKCIFFLESDTPIVIGTISFNLDLNKETAILDLSERPFSKIEKDLYQIRKIALDKLLTDSIFKFYQNTSPNLIPIINGKEKKVYILTGSTKNGVVFFGNDYLLTFNNNNQFVSTKKIHNDIISVKYGSNDSIVIGGIHNHLPTTGDFITATDICTLMLYEKIAKWHTYVVVSKKYLNTWNCETDELTVISMDVVGKIYNDNSKKNNQKQ